MRSILVLFCLLFVSGHCMASTHSITSESISPTELTLTITLKLDPQEALYEDSLSLSVDNPDIMLSRHVHEQAGDVFDPTIQAARKAFTETLTIICTVQKKSETFISNAHLHVYYLTNQAQPQHFVVPLSFEKNDVPGSPLVEPDSATERKNDRYTPSKMRSITYDFGQDSTPSNTIPLEPRRILLLSLIVCWIWYGINRYQHKNTQTAFLCCLIISAAVGGYSLSYAIKHFML